MDNKYVIEAKRELLRFLKKHNAVALYVWTVYGYEKNEQYLKILYNQISNPKTSFIGIITAHRLLIGCLRKNPNIKDKKYWDENTLCDLYLLWDKHIRTKYNIKPRGHNEPHLVLPHRYLC